MTLLVTSCIALISGPLFVSYAKPSVEYFTFLKRLIVVVITGLVVLHIVPHAFYDAGTIAIPMAVLGFVVPLLAEQMMQAEKTHTASSIFTVLVLLALGLHGFIDGAALVDHQVLHTDHVHDEEWLGLGVVLHRVPLGLTLWWITESKFGNKTAAIILIAMMVMTALGTFWGQTWMEFLSLNTIGVFQALMGGGILHIVVDDLKLNTANKRKH